MVYSRDLIPQESAAPPVHDNIPIVKLYENQKVVLEAKATVNIGKEHAKWQPVAVCTIKPSSKITIDQKKCDH
jgi:DNA-directed RNA polymerase subunit D